MEIAIGKSKEIAGNKFRIELWGDNARDNAQCECVCECGVSIPVSTLVSTLASTLACLLGARNVVKWQRP